MGIADATNGIASPCVDDYPLLSIIRRRREQQADKVAPLVLSIALPRCIRSKRWKEVVEPQPQRFMHHLELYDVGDVHEEVRAWLRDAWADAGEP